MNVGETTDFWITVNTCFEGLFLRGMIQSKPPAGKGGLTPQQALQKLKHFCAYQERCHSEVKAKLYQLGLWKKHHDEIIATLIEEDYLNEERFAIAFARGKIQDEAMGEKKN